MSNATTNEAALRQPPFADYLGIKITSVSPERVTAELLAREEFNNRHGIMHGGAIMALADNLGGTATTANINATSTIAEKRASRLTASPHGGR